jgi:beta-lactamase regulating signal transducer with metallopeptidase domain
MNTLSWWLAQNTITVALLIPMVALACRLFRNRPAVQHLLWAVVLIKFITPPLAEWPWSVPQLGPWAHSVSATDLSPPLAASSEREAAGIPEAESSRAADDRDELSSPGAVAALAQPRRLAGSLSLVTTWLALLTGLWFLGFVVSAARQVRRIKRHASLVRLAKKAPQSLTLEIEAIALEVSVRPPRALVTGGIVSPFTWFLGRLCLVWPETMSGRDEVARSRGVIAHELAHVRRGDHYLAWLELVAGLVWWWNPLFWFVRRRLRESAELACDAIALSVCQDGRRSYAELLLALSSGSKSPFLAPVLGIRAASAASFERRLSMILSDRVSAKVPVWGLAAAALLALVSLPGWSVAQKPAERTAPTAIAAEDQPGQNAGATAARLEQIEAELKRLSLLLEEAKRSAASTPRQAPAPVLDDSKALAREPIARWRKLKVIDKKPAAVSFEGKTNIYVLGTNDGKAYVTALDKQGERIWRIQLPITLHDGDGGEWSLVEIDERKVVVVSWAGAAERVTYHLDAARGRITNERKDGNHFFRRGSDGGFQVPDEPLARRPEKASVAERLQALNARSDHVTLYERQVKLAQPDEVLTTEIFRSLLNRDPTSAELASATKHFATATTAGNRGSAVEDLFWVIINSHEYQASKKPGPGQN